MPDPDYSDIAFDERAHDDDDEAAEYLVEQHGTDLIVSLHIGDIEQGQLLLDRFQLFDYLDEFLDRGGMLRMEQSS
ncbi:hypothetical protein N799_05335 [Lysobacter arseniciresistens ZS79]|uniref:Uncharacterized protein n=1 Tax=Lysobacter arseniciresistens ZS79 TaxID=913325 RepID=A0A0A0F543_9GAMM|nr:hypothetical protein [Lysobacter arseniciresistens]KGM57488.1 hypothetical protein N799_05335 [Lysobacter arseniciresistens ZS79]